MRHRHRVFRDAVCWGKEARNEILTAVGGRRDKLGDDCHIRSKSGDVIGAVEDAKAHTQPRCPHPRSAVLNGAPPPKP